MHRSLFSSMMLQQHRRARLFFLIIVGVITTILRIDFVLSSSSSSGGNGNFDRSTTTGSTGGLPRSNPSSSPYSTYSSTSRTDRKKNTLPRSSRSTIRRRSIVQYTSDHNNENADNDGCIEYNQYDNYQPWNPSPYIDSAGFLTGYYERMEGEWEKEMMPHQFRSKINQQLKKQPLCQIRQVPGDGNCLFHSISLCLYHAVNGTHWDITGSLCEGDESSHSINSNSKNHHHHAYEELYYHSQQLRQAAVECLSGCISNTNARSLHQNSHYPYQRLYLQGREYLQTSELVQAASQQYGMTPSEYCEAMKQESVWGGGPEIVALSNVLKRPIHVYELATSQHKNYKKNANCFVLRRMACFGSPRFDRNTALHILSADSRFPDIQPGQQLPAGNHFLAVFPLQEDSHLLHDKNKKKDSAKEYEKRRKQRIRGGFAIYRRRRRQVVDDTSAHHQDCQTCQHGNDDDDTVKTADDDDNVSHRHSSNNNPSHKHNSSNKFIQWWKDIVNHVLLR